MQKVQNEAGHGLLTLHAGHWPQISRAAADLLLGEMLGFQDLLVFHLLEAAVNSLHSQHHARSFEDGHDAPSWLNEMESRMCDC